LKTKNYSDFLNQACAYIGVDYADLQPDEVALLNSFFNKQINHIWNLYHWVDVCPYGEYRVPNNVMTNSKDLISCPTVGATIVEKWSKNPTDNATNAALLVETSANGPHGLFISWNPTCKTSYTFSAFLYPTDAQYAIIGMNSAYGDDAVFDLVNASVFSAAPGVVASINRISGGWVQVSIVKEIDTLQTQIISIFQSKNGVTSSYLGSPANGLGIYFPSIAPTNLTGSTLQLVDWEQPGMDAIDVVFDVWSTSPLSSATPKRCPYKLTPNGIQLYATASTGIPYYQILSPNQAASSTTITPQAPVYLHYRTRCPNFSGATYTTTAGYAAGVTLYYTYADTITTNYVKTLVATNPGDTPENAPSKFKVLLVPQFAFDFVVQGVLADWLMTERQFAKAQVVRMGAQEMMDREVDRQERQMGVQFPFKVHTHFTSRANPTR